MSYRVREESLSACMMHGGSFPSIFQQLDLSYLPTSTIEKVFHDVARNHLSMDRQIPSTGEG
jgi:hypothetical protein